MAAEMAALGSIDGRGAPGGMLTTSIVRRGDAARARPRVDLNGALVDQIDFEGATERIRGFLDAGRAHQIVTVNLDFLNIAERDPHFRDTINRADLAVADGMPLVWASRLTDPPLPQRIAGVDLVDACCEIAAERAAGVFLLGAGPGVAENRGAALEDLYPGLLIAGTYSPPFGSHTAGQRADRGDDPHGAPGVPLRRLRGPPPGHVDPGAPGAAGRAGLHGRRLRARPAGGERQSGARCGCSGVAWSGPSASARSPGASGGATS